MESERERLLREIDSCQREIVDRCFSRTESAADLPLADRYVKILRALAKLDRQQLLHLEFLGTTPETGLATAGTYPGSGLLLFRRLADASGFGLAVADLRGRLTYANPALRRMVGLPGPDEAIGKNLFEFYSPDTQATLRDRIIPKVLDEGQWTGELSLRHARGEAIATHQNFFLVRGEADGKPYLANLLIDITQRRRIEDALRASEERFRAVFENSAIGIYRMAPSGRVLMANPALLRMLGFSTFAEIEDLDFGDFASLESRAEFLRRMELGGELRGHEAVWLRHDGTPLHVRESGRAIRDGSGRVQYYEGSVEDVSEIRRAIEALRGSEENFRALAENANDAILIFKEEEDQLVYFNPRAVEITGYAAEELRGRPCREILPLDEAETAGWRGRRNARAPAKHQFETRIATKDRGSVPVEITTAVTVWLGARSSLIVLRDITERKSAEQALRESQERYRRLAEEIDEIIYEFDAEGRMAYISPAIERIFGWRPDEMIGRTFAEFVPPEDSEEALKRLQRVRDGLGPTEAEIRVLNKNGEVRWLRHHSRLIVSDGRVVGMRGVGADVTDRKLAEQALRESEERYRLFIEDGNQLVYELDLDGRLRFVSRAVERILGIAPDEMIGHEVTEFQPPEELPKSLELLARLRQEPAEIEDQIQLRTRSGETRWLRCYARPILKEGHPVGIRGVMHDVTGLVSAQRALAESEAKYAAIVENAADVISIIQDERVVFINPAIQRVSGHTPEELIGRSIREFIPKKEIATRMELLKRRIAGEELPRIVTVPVLRRDGSVIVVETAISVIPFRGRPAALYVMRELSERRHDGASE